MKGSRVPRARRPRLRQRGRRATHRSQCGDRRRRPLPTPVPPLGVEGLSIVKPPYGVLSAIDLNKGDLMWQVPHGDTPDVVRNHPAAEGHDHSEDRPERRGRTGHHPHARRSCGDPQVTSPPGRPRGAMLRAYDKKTGAEVGAVYLPAQQSGSPMTYMLDGKQYIVVAVSGGNYSGEYIAFALPTARD